MWARRPESRANRSIQAELNTGLPPDLTLTGIKPLAFTAARKSERMLAKGLGGEADRHRVDGGEPSADRWHIERDGGRLVSQQVATRFTAETRSRRRVAVSLPSRSRAASTSRQGDRPAGRGVRSILLAFPAHVIPPFGSFGPGPERSREDRG